MLGMVKVKCHGEFKHEAKRKRKIPALAPAKVSHATFMHWVILPLQELVTHGSRMTAERKEALIDKLRNFGQGPVMPIMWPEAARLFVVASDILHKAHSEDHAQEIRQLARSVSVLRAALENRSGNGVFGKSAKTSRHGILRKRENSPVVTGELGKAVRSVVKDAAIVLQFINCHNVKVSVSDQGGEKRIVIEGPSGGGDPDPGGGERLHKITGVSCPYVVDEKKNTITYRSNGHDQRQTTVYRIPTGAASKAVNVLVKGMVDGIKAGNTDWNARFDGCDAKALGRATKLDNRKFMAECVIRAGLKGNGNQTYANLAQLFHVELLGPKNPGLSK